MDTTPKVTPSNANGISESNQDGQVSPTLSKEVGGELAKECGGSKKPQHIGAASNKLYDESGKLRSVTILVAEGELRTTGLQFAQWYREKYPQ